MRIEDIPSSAEWSAWAAEGIAIDSAAGDRAPLEVTLGPDAHAWCAHAAIAWREPQLRLRADRAADAALGALAEGPGRLALGWLGAVVSLHLAPGDTLRAHPDAVLLASGGCIRLPPTTGIWTAGLRRYGAGERPGLLLLAGRGCLFHLELGAGERILVSGAGLLCVRGAIVLEPQDDAASGGLVSLIACQGEGTLIVQSGPVARMLHRTNSLALP